jgi:predicted transcriptional regulator
MENVGRVKEETRKLVEGLPEDVTWDEVARRVFERRMIERGRADIAEGRYFTTDQVREKLGLPRESE